jgi:hypothetical protein
VVPCAHSRPLPHTPGAVFAFVLGRDPWSYLALSRALPVPHLLLHSVGILVMVLYPRPLSALCLLGRDPWWWCHGPAHPLPRTPGATVPAHPLSHTPGAAFAQLGCLVVALCACLPSPMHSQHCCACSPSLAHSWHYVCSVGMLGGGAMCPLALFHTLLALLCLLTLSRTLLAPHLLSWDTWWWCCVPACPLPHTPGTTVPACPLSHTPGTAFAWLGSLVVAPCACPHPLLHTPC